MTHWLFLEAVVAGIVYAIVPGPATLAVLGLAASAAEISGYSTSRRMR